jgi:hypothetical protein
MNGHRKDDTLLFNSSAAEPHNPQLRQTWRTHMSRPPLPPFTEQTATKKARLAEDGWNTRDPAKVALAYTPDSQWRNRAEFLSGRDAIEAFSRPQVDAGA